MNLRDGRGMWGVTLVTVDELFTLRAITSPYIWR